MPPLVDKVLTLMAATVSATVAYMSQSKLTDTRGKKECNASNVVVDDDAGNQDRRTRKNIDDRKLQSGKVIKIGFSVSLTGPYSVAPGFKEQLDVTNYIWTTNVQTNADTFKIGSSGASFIIDYDDDQSDLAKVIQIYTFLAGLSFEYDALVTTHPLMSKADVLWGPSNPQFAKVAVSIAKKAHLPIVLWAQDEFVYWTVPGWKHSLVNIERLMMTNFSTEGNATNVSSILKMLSDGQKSDQAECPMSLTDLRSRVKQLTQNDAWYYPNLDVAKRVLAKMPQGPQFRNDPEIESSRILEDVRRKYYRKHEASVCQPDSMGKSTFITKAADCWTAVVSSGALPPGIDFEQQEINENAYFPSGCSYEQIGEGALSMNIATFNRFSGAPNMQPINTRSTIVCSEENQLATQVKQYQNATVNLLVSEITRMQDLPQCGGTGDQFRMKGMGALSRLPQWLALNRGAPYMLLQRELSRKAFLQHVEPQGSASASSMATSEQMSLNASLYFDRAPQFKDLADTLLANMPAMRNELLNLSRSIIMNFEALQDLSDVADIDGPAWDIGYKYAYDVNCPLSLFLTDALRRLQPKPREGRAWFFSDLVEHVEGHRGQFTCIAGAKEAMALNYSEVLVHALDLKEASRWVLYMQYFGMPEALVLCGSVAFTVEALLLLKASALVPKSVVVTVKKAEDLVSSLGGQMMNYILQPLSFPIFNPSLESYLFAFTNYRYSEYVKHRTSKAFLEWEAQMPNISKPAGIELPGVDGYFSLISHQISAAGSLVTFAAATSSANQGGFFDRVTPEDFAQAFCPQLGAETPYGSPAQLPTEMGTIRFNCGSIRKLGKRAKAAELATTRPRNTLSSTRQLMPLSRTEPSTLRYLDSFTRIVANRDDVIGIVRDQSTGEETIVGTHQPLAKGTSASELVYPMIPWTEKELEVYPCRPGCSFSAKSLKCTACPPGTYRVQGVVCEPCRREITDIGAEIDTYSDSWAYSRCLEVPEGADFMGVDQMPVAQAGYYHLNALPCTADFGSKLGDPHCCSQLGVVEDMLLVCPTAHKPYCVNFQGLDVNLGTCQAWPIDVDPFVGDVCDIEAANKEWAETTSSDVRPPCTVTDGRKASLKYPCTCGQVVCKAGAACYSSLSLCMEDLDAPVFAKCNFGLCIGRNKCRPGNVGALCLSCQDGYQNVNVRALLSGRACLQCPSKAAMFVFVILLIIFWMCCVMTLSLLFARDAAIIVSVRGPVVRLLITYFQLSGVISELIDTANYESLYGAHQFVRSFTETLFLKPFDLVSTDCIFGQIVTFAEAPHLARMSSNIALAFGVFLAGVLGIILANGLLFAVHTARKIKNNRGAPFTLQSIQPFLFGPNIDTDGEPAAKRNSSEPVNANSFAHPRERLLTKYAKGMLVNEMRMLESDVIRQLTAWFILMYPVLIRIILHLIRCDEAKSLIARLARRFEVVCYSGVHMEYFPFGVVVAVLWSVTIPAICLSLGLANRDVNALAVKKRASYGVVLMGYRPHRSWWHAWVMARFSLIFAACCFTQPLMRVFMAWVVLMSSLMLHVHYQPYVTSERYGLWYLELYMVLAVMAALLMYVFQMYMDYIGILKKSDSRVLARTVLYALLLLEYVLWLITLFYSLWILLVTTVDPQVSIYQELQGKRNVHFLYRLYGKLVSKSRGMNAIIVGWRQAGDKYININRLTRSEQRFLIFNLKNTLQACFDAHPCFNPMLISVAFHEAFRRAIISRRARWDAIQTTAVTSRLAGESEIRERIKDLHSRINNVGLGLRKLESEFRQESTSADAFVAHRFGNVRAEIQRKQEVQRKLEKELDLLQDAIRLFFVIPYSNDYMFVFNSELKKLVDRLHAKGMSIIEVEAGLTLTDCKGHELSRDLRFIDHSQFPIHVRFDNSKQVTVEELCAALAEVNIDITSHHPEFVRYFPRLAKKKHKTEETNLVPPRKSEGTNTSKSLLSSCLRRIRKPQNELPHSTEQLQTLIGKSEATDTANALVPARSNKMKEKRADEWKRCEQEWWTKAHAKQERKPSAGIDVTQTVDSDKIAWDKAATSLMQGMRVAEEMRHEGEIIGSLRSRCIAMQRYRDALRGRLVILGVYPDISSMGEIRVKFDPLNREDKRGIGLTSFLQDLRRQRPDELDDNRAFEVKLPEPSIQNNSRAFEIKLPKPSTQVDWSANDTEQESDVFCEVELVARAPRARFRDTSKAVQESTRQRPHLTGHESIDDLASVAHEAPKMELHPPLDPAPIDDAATIAHQAPLMELPRPLDPSPKDDAGTVSYEAPLMVPHSEDLTPIDHVDTEADKKVPIVPHVNLQELTKASLAAFGIVRESTDVETHPTARPVPLRQPLESPHAVALLDDFEDNYVLQKEYTGANDSEWSMPGV